MTTGRENKSGITRNRQSKELIEERREIVKRYLMRGYTASQIHGLMIAPPEKGQLSRFAAIPIATVHNDMSIVMGTIKQNYITLDGDQFVASSLALHDELIRQAWLNYAAEAPGKARNEILKTISDLNKTQLQLLDKLGLLTTASRVPENDNSWEATIRRLRETRGLEAPKLIAGDSNQTPQAAPDEEEEIVPLGEMRFERDESYIDVESVQVSEEN